jgi:hypothetical protein
MMSKKHESVEAKNLFYCFVNISKDTSVFKFYILPSKVVAKYAGACTLAKGEKERGQTSKGNRYAHFPDRNAN